MEPINILTAIVLGVLFGLFLTWIRLRREKYVSLVVSEYLTVLYADGIDSCGEREFYVKHSKDKEVLTELGVCRELYVLFREAGIGLKAPPNEGI